MQNFHSSLCDKAESACAWALQVLPAGEVPAIQAHISSCPDCRRELESLRPVIECFCAWPADVLRPARSLQERLAHRIAKATGKLPVMPPERRWSDSEWEQAAPGIERKVLATDATGHRASLLLRLAPKAGYHARGLAGAEELFLLDGELWVGDHKLFPGDYHYSTAGTGEVPVWSETGCTCFLVTNLGQLTLSMAELSHRYSRHDPAKDITTSAVKDMPWSYAQTATLWEQARRQVPLQKIAAILAKSQSAVLKKARELGIPIKDTRPSAGDQPSRSSKPQ